MRVKITTQEKTEKRRERKDWGVQSMSMELGRNEGVLQTNPSKQKRANGRSWLLWCFCMRVWYNCVWMDEMLMLMMRGDARCDDRKEDVMQKTCRCSFLSSYGVARWCSVIGGGYGAVSIGK